MNATLRLARAHGAGTILTDGVNLFKISDYSPSSGDVYGWPCGAAGERTGSYRKLPTSGLRAVKQEQTK